jgi:hypothetical protein
LQNPCFFQTIDNNIGTTLVSRKEVVMATTNDKSFWYGNVADDHNGHQGAGYTPEAAQEALEQAQRDGVPSAEYKGITGQVINNERPL